MLCAVFHDANAADVLLWVYFLVYYSVTITFTLIENLRCNLGIYYMYRQLWFIFLRHAVNVDFCGHSSILIRPQKLTTFVSLTFAKSEFGGGPFNYKLRPIPQTFR